MRCIVTGKTGQIVTALIEVGQRLGINIVALGRPEIDLTDQTSVVTAIRLSGAEIVINAAAYTAVDRAESEPDQAMAINGTGAGAVAIAAAAMGIPVIHLSTDYVFSGDKTNAYIESDLPDPKSVYGRTKLAGEKLVAAANPRHVILRTSWIFAPFGHNFLRTMLRLADTEAHIGVVGDQYGNPSYALDIAEALLNIASVVLEDPSKAEHYGVFHLTGSGKTSWADFAKSILIGSAERGGRVSEIKTITTSQYPTAAYRPVNSCMDGTKLHSVYGIILPPWHDALNRCLDRLVGELTLEFEIKKGIQLGGNSLY